MSYSTPSTNSALALQSVIDLHDLIERVFTTQNNENLTALYQGFHPDFEMITTTGNLVTLENVKQLFSTKHGARPTLKITVNNIKVISESAEKIWLQYQETHDEHNHSLSRLSTVCITINAGKACWFYLHETAI